MWYVWGVERFMYGSVGMPEGKETTGKSSLYVGG
jgi:hypothetical protein